MQGPRFYVPPPSFDAGPPARSPPPDAATALACSVSWMAMEYLALHDGLLQRVTTAGDDLVLHGEPFRERPDDRSRSGVPEGLVTVDSIPSGCRCSWAYSQGRLTLKYSNTACPVLRDHRPQER